MRHAETRLISISREISALEDERAVLKEQLAFTRDVMDEAQVRALVAETPLADRELRVATQDCRRVERGLHETEGRLATLRMEQDRLLAAMVLPLSNGSGPGKLGTGEPS